jgi:hypothetical protein
MNILLDEHKTIILQLLRAHVEFILIGGYAVIYHGYGRFSGSRLKKSTITIKQPDGTYSSIGRSYRK